MPNDHTFNCARLCISAISGGGGKTLLSLSLASALTKLGLNVIPFKKGPDYIDALWLSLAANREATNLDPYFLSANRLSSLFQYAYKREEQVQKDNLALIEGNRGLYDGFDPQGSCSTAELARILQAPIILSFDCTKMTRTVAAILQGLMNFEKNVPLVGLVLNQVASERHAKIIENSIKEYTDLKVFGILPRLKENPLPERHMGIATQYGAAQAKLANSIIAQLAQLAIDHLDLEAIINLAKKAKPLPKALLFWQAVQENQETQVASSPLIGYVKDEALWFYYRENLEALERAGAKLISLSLLDHEPWPELDGLYLGGGFPESWLEALSHSAKLQLIKTLALNGLPIYAECGGFLLLTQSMQIKTDTWQLANIFPVAIKLYEKPQGLGYIEGEIVRANPYFPLGLTLRGHEFHYSCCQNAIEANLANCALKLSYGHGLGNKCSGFDGLIFNNVWGSYCHIFAPSIPIWAENFVKLARKYKKR